MIRLFILTLFGFLSFTIIAQTSDEAIGISRHLTMQDGLSHFGVTCILEDHKGLIWVGTFNGLNKYDGYEFKEYRNGHKDTLITSNRVSSLFQDQNNNILIGTEGGLSLYEYSTGRFKTIYTSEKSAQGRPGPVITQIAQLGYYVICLTKSEGLLLFDAERYVFLGSYVPDSVDKRTFLPRACMAVNSKFMTIASNRGLFLFDVDKIEFEQIVEDDVPYASDIVFDHKQFMYVLQGWSLGMVELTSFENNAKPRFKYLHKVLGVNDFINIDVDKEGKMWLMKRNNHLTMIPDPENMRYNSFQRRDFSFKNKFTRLSCIVSNTSSGGWVGSFNQGLFRFSTTDRVFVYNDLEGSKLRSNVSSNVREAVVVNDSLVLLAMYENRAHLLNVKNSSISPLENFAKPVKHAFLDSRGMLWLSTWDRGIYFKRKNEHRWTQLIEGDYGNIAVDRVEGFGEGDEGELWVGGLSTLYRLRFKGQQIESVEELELLGKEGVIISVVYPDPEKKGVIWVGTRSDGLFRIETTGELYDSKVVNVIPEKKDESSLPSYFVSSIMRLPSGELWIGTEQGGISQVIESNRNLKFKTYSEQDGLDNYDVRSFLFDGDEHLWVATNKGINQFNLKTRKFRNFNLEDGLIPSSFEITSINLPDNRMLFGGNNGVCYVDPVHIAQDKGAPQLRFGELSISNVPIEVGQPLYEKVILSKPLDDIEVLELDYNENSLSIELISLHYSNAESHLIKYRLLPEDTEWFVTSSQNKKANFSMLPSGHYIFEVATSNSKKEWSDLRRLEIIVNPPWWKTTLAYVIYFVLCIVIGFIIFRVLLSFNKLEYNLELEQLEKKRAVELDSARIKLFMNISHEFRTPLTLISGAITVLRKMLENNQDAFNHIDLVHRQSKKMFQLVDQVHDLRRGEQNLLKLNMQSFDFTDFITNIKQDFERLARDTGKDLILDGEANQLFVMADEQKLEVVLNNLLNNAFKFTKKGDSITIRYGLTEKGFFFEVEDTGKGIHSEDIDNLFKRFYQSKQGDGYSVGSGIGLELTKMLVEMHFGEIEVNSKYGEGAKFSVFMPVKVSREDKFSEKRIKEILEDESHEDKQKVEIDTFDLANLIMDSSLNTSTIYFVEDNHDLRGFVEGVLRDYFRVVSFSNGRECMDALEEEWPDIIISDILMPELNGLELCKNVKADIRTSHIPVILLTSRSSIDERIEGLDMGADSYITKPFEMRHLLAVTQNILLNRKKLRERFKVDFPLSLEKKQQSESDQIFLEKLYKLMEDNLDNEEMDLNQFTRELHMNRNQFFKKVKAITNTTPKEIVRSYRLKKAAEYLISGEFTVIEVCYKTGFKNRAYFSTLFKEYYGVSPSQYGKQD
ncbi:hybrid sensor histidine kinase/response regulator transcription factor [Reichenbachiella versicolor]|uniref:hybrid sensor histidine kinase/response regulator transcription factor n=1 Tax=Reichenbachiella versicolor TaxID=1821036 RepID=UPI001C87A4A8|nr:hybrid sensor histidine kinase/response regulator transcription factor [Reichenbachiella versicolor]